MNRTIILAVILAVLVVVAITMCVRSTGSGSAPTVGGAWFYDLQTGKLFAADERKIPPIAAPSKATVEGQEAGVRAYIFSCGDCPQRLQNMTLVEVETAGAFVGYLEKFTAQAKQQLDQVFEQPYAPGSPTTPLEVPHLWNPVDRHLAYPRPDGAELRWVSAASAEGIQIERDVLDRCEEGTRPKVCLP